jgi:hypothetical protein
MSLVLGFWMARRSKMAFVSLPGFASSACCLGMIVAPISLSFFVLLGFCNLFEIITRPAVTAIIRSNYPVEIRGWVTGKLRRCSAVAFLAAAYGTASLLDYDGRWLLVRAVIIIAALLRAIAYLAFSLIRVRPDPATEEEQSDLRTFVHTTTSMLRRERRFLRYLAGRFLFGASGLTYEPLVRAFFASDLHLNYTQCVVTADVLPGLCSVLTLHRLGAWLDRTNPLLAWAAIRLGWGIDALMLAIAPASLPGSLLIGAAARSVRGFVMNGSWILWWQLGTNYFASRRDLTSVYNGLHIGLNGVQRICAPPIGAGLSSVMSRHEALAIGGFFVIVSAYLAWRQGEAEKVDNRRLTFSEKEQLDLAT